MKKISLSLVFVIASMVLVKKSYADQCPPQYNLQPQDYPYLHKVILGDDSVKENNEYYVGCIYFDRERKNTVIDYVRTGYKKPIIPLTSDWEEGNYNLQCFPEKNGDCQWQELET